MEITFEIKKEFIDRSAFIQNVKVLYKKRKVIEGKPEVIAHDPFEVILFNLNDQDDDNASHLIDFESAIEITIIFHDKSIKVFKDE
ncbi:hypothetical protein [Chryseobacterium echinoideorum]|uniref:hypothetical protein n=1 Tax=Chryseobacterium echinoideorum TaxID=1549648 RepID=UPI0011870B15|nr:hypothetical protein [Chryseobacterium echinoideorum]